MPPLHIDTLIYWVGMAAVAVCALTGVIDAARKQMDLIGALLVGVATALGGGTLRDLLIARPVFWVVDQTYLMVALGAALLSFMLLSRRALSARWFLLPDAIGLALFSVLGTQVALQWQAPWLAASLLGVMTGVAGGVTRDILCNDVPSVFLKGELYATAAWAGALLLIGLQAMDIAPAAAAGLAMAFTLGLRLLAVRYRLTLPALVRQTDSH